MLSNTNFVHGDNYGLIAIIYIASLLSSIKKLEVTHLLKIKPFNSL